jgi:hypothetical protein
LFGSDFRGVNILEMKEMEEPITIKMRSLESAILS